MKTQNIIALCATMFLLLSAKADDSTNSTLTISQQKEQCEAAYKLYNAGDYAKALQGFQTLAAQGNVPAECAVGLMYRLGQGVAQDYVEAIRWFRKAAEQNYNFAEYHMGDAYKYGLGVTQDTVEAIRWYQRAVAHGNKYAAKRLEELGATPPADNAPAVAANQTPVSQADGPSEQETIDWLKHVIPHLENNYVLTPISYPNARNSDSIQISTIEIIQNKLVITTSLTIVSSGWDMESLNRAQTFSYTNSVRLNLLFQDATIEPTLTDAEVSKSIAAGNQVTAQTGKKIILSGRNDESLQIPVEDEYAERVKKALEHLIKLSGGGGQEPF